MNPPPPRATNHGEEARCASQQSGQKDISSEQHVLVIPRITTSNIEAGENGLLFLKMEKKAI